jgi:hypothetical protein
LVRVPPTSPRETSRRGLNSAHHYWEFGSVGSAVYERCHHRALVVIHGPSGDHANGTNPHTIVVKDRTTRPSLDGTTYYRPSDAEIEMLGEKSEVHADDKL